MATKHHNETKAEKRGDLPETVVLEGTSKRNIIRKGGKPRYRKEATPGSHLLNDATSAMDAPVVLDPNDPNYDSEDDFTDDLYTPSDDSQGIGQSKIKLSEYKKLIEPLILEFFVSGAIDDMLESLVEIGAKAYTYEFVKRSINMSLDQGDRARELLSQLISKGYPDVFSTSVVGKGFERLFELVDEIEKDAPLARVMLAKFLARAVVDEVLPPSFLCDAVIVNLGGDVVVNAKRMLSREHGHGLLEHSWGPGDGRPVEELKVAVDQLLLEFLLSGDKDEAIRCVGELREEHFAHEVVKRAVSLSLDKPEDKQMQVSSLFAALASRGLLSHQQAAQGMDKVYRALPDLKLDTPAAESLVDGFFKRAVADGLLPDHYTPPVAH